MESSSQWNSSRNWQHCPIYRLQLLSICGSSVDSYSLFASTHVISIHPSIDESNCVYTHYTYVYVCTFHFDSVTQSTSDFPSKYFSSTSPSCCCCCCYVLNFLIVRNFSQRFIAHYMDLSIKSMKCVPFRSRIFHISFYVKFLFVSFFFSLFFTLVQVIRADRSDKWTLQIKFPQPRDAGIYECQVNTEPKMSMPFRLNVVGEYHELFIALSLHHLKFFTLESIFILIAFFTFEFGNYVGLCHLSREMSIEERSGLLCLVNEIGDKN